MFTLEAGLIFPTLILANLAFLFFVLHIYQVVTLQIQASMAAERIAQHWHESPATGRLPLYWRITDASSVEVKIPTTGHASYTGSSISEQKMAAGVRGIPEGVGGTVSFKNHVFRQFITVRLEHPVKISRFVTRWLPTFGAGGKAVAETTSEAMDSAEIARYADFAFGYALKKDSNSITATKDAYVKVFQLISRLIKK